MNLIVVPEFSIAVKCRVGKHWMDLSLIRLILKTKNWAKNSHIIRVFSHHLTYLPTWQGQGGARPGTETLSSNNDNAVQGHNFPDSTRRGDAEAGDNNLIQVALVFIPFS